MKRIIIVLCLLPLFCGITLTAQENRIDAQRIAADGNSIRNSKKLICFDLDATLTRHKTPLEDSNRKVLDTLARHYDLCMVVAGNCKRVYEQMGHYPIDIVGNYGMQVATVENGELKILEEHVIPVDEVFFRKQNKYLRRKYGYTRYSGEPLEFHKSGMVTMGLLGTTPSIEDKLAFDPDRAKRRVMYPEVCSIFKDYTVYIGGSTSFDFSGKEFNKYDATMAYAAKHGYRLEDILFVGDDFADGGGDSHVRIKGMDYIEVDDYTRLPEILSFLFAGPDPRSRLVAHRGGRHEQEENTLEAFKATYEAGCHGFETDVHITADGEYVIMHDHYLGRMTDGEGKVEKSTASYIRSLTTKKGHKVPFLKDLLDYFKGCSSLYVEWELKTNEEDYPEELLHRYCDEVYALITAARPADAIYIFSSFDPRALDYIRSRHPEALLQYITGDPCTHANVDFCVEHGYNQMAATLNRSSREAVSYAHSKGLKINLWPGSKPEDSALAVYLGVDYPCTDYPQAVMKYAAEHRLALDAR